MKKIFLIWVSSLLMVSVAHGYTYIPDPLDPAVMHIGSPPNSGTFLFGSEVRPISNSTLGILENGGGQPILDNPLLLILGVPNKTGADFTAPSIALSVGTGIVGGTNAFSGAWNVSTGYAGNFTATSSYVDKNGHPKLVNDVYQFIGLNPYGNASNNFENWYNADKSVNGINAAGFGIFVYELTGSGIKGDKTVDVTFSSDLGKGIFAVAYGQENGTSYTTPFTESGLTGNGGGGGGGGGGGTPVPEPGTLILVGAGLAGLAMYRRKM